MSKGSEGSLLPTHSSPPKEQEDLQFFCYVGENVSESIRPVFGKAGNNFTPALAERKKRMGLSFD